MIDWWLVLWIACGVIGGLTVGWFIGYRAGDRRWR
jgi:hypothetical protein